MPVVLIEAKMNDYLENRQTGKVVEGNKRFKQVETACSFTKESGECKVSDIEEGGVSLA